MYRAGMRDHLLNESDEDLLDTATAWDQENAYGQFDTFSSIDEAVECMGWDAAEAVQETHGLDVGAYAYREDGYGHLEAIESRDELIESARDEIDNIIDWLENGVDGSTRQNLPDTVVRIMDAEDPFKAMAKVDVEIESVKDDGLGTTDIVAHLSSDLGKGDVSLSVSTDELDTIDGFQVVYEAEDQALRHEFDTPESIAEKFNMSPEEAKDNAEYLDGIFKNSEAVHNVLEDSEIEAIMNYMDVQCYDQAHLDCVSIEAAKDPELKEALDKLDVPYDKQGESLDEMCNAKTQEAELGDDGHQEMSAEQERE